MRDSRSLVYSATLHGLILVLLIFGLPGFFHRQIEVEPEAISVDILPIAPVSNVRPQERTLEKPQQKPVADRTTERKAAPDTKREETKPVEKPETVSAAQLAKKPEKKPERKKPDEPKKEDDLASVLKSVENTAKSEESKKPTQARVVPNQHEAKSQHYDPGAPLSMSQQDAIKQQIELHWNAPVGAKNAADLTVSLHIEMNPDGTVTKVELADDKARYYSDSFFQAAVDSAIRAVKMASPLKDLPQDKYNVRDGWSDIIMTFPLKDAVN